jgi:ABC-type transport system involved in multi-copper enzyme maturation permease subunit
MSKFYREIALKLMSAATALTVLILGTRQLPREFSSRTIYPLLARPVQRGSFLMGKLLGVSGAGFFCLFLFLLLYVIGCLGMGAPVYHGLLFQHLWLQLCMVVLLSSLSLLLSLLFDLDAAICIGALLLTLSAVISNLFLLLYENAGVAARHVLELLTWILPQISLFSLVEKNVHGELWDLLTLTVMAQLTAYALVCSCAYLVLTWWLFRRRPL